MKPLRLLFLLAVAFALVARASAATASLTFDPATYILKEPTAAQLATANAFARFNTAQTWTGAQTFNAATIFGGTINFGSAALTYSANQISWASVNKTGAVKADVGLGNVDNTADTAKPVSTAQAAADAVVLASAATDATTKANAAQAAAIQRANHTGTQPPASLQVSATARILGRTTAAAGPAEELTAAQTKSLLAIIAADVSGLAASATTDTTNAANITTGTLPVARLAAIPNSALVNSAITIAGVSTSLGGTITTDTLDGGLAANGLIARTAANTRTARTLTGTAGQITVTNGDGVAGNPTVSLPTALTSINSVTAAASTDLTLSAGSTAGQVIVSPTGTSNFQYAHSTTGRFLLYSASSANITQDIDFSNPSLGVSGAGVRIRAERTALTGAPTQLSFWTTSGGTLLKGMTLTEGSLGVNTGNLLIGGTTDIPGAGGLKVFGNTAATSTTTGAFQVAGGMSAQGSIYTGGSATFGTPNTAGNGVGSYGASPAAGNFGFTSGSITATNMYGFTDQTATYTLNGAATEVMSHRAYASLALGANALTNWYGFSSTLNSKTGAGVLTNAYAFYATSPTQATNNYAFFSAGSAPSQFGGKIQATGNAATTEALDLVTSTGAGGTAQWYAKGGNGAVTIFRMLRGNGASGYVANGLNIDSYDAFQVGLNVLGGSGGSFVVRTGGTTDLLTVASTGATTFASSLSAGGNLTLTTPTDSRINFIAGQTAWLNYNLAADRWTFRHTSTGVTSLTLTEASATFGGTTAATSTTTGSLINSGGFGNAGDIWGGGKLRIGGNSLSTLDGGVGADVALTSSSAANVLGLLQGSSGRGFQIYQNGYVNNTTGGAISIQASTTGATVSAGTNGGAAGGTISFAAPTLLSVLNTAANSIQSAGGIVSTSATTGLGYATGAGGTITQNTSKATGVTLSKVTGAITTAADALAAATVVSFVLTNTAIAATDALNIEHVSGGTVGAYKVSYTAAAGSATIFIRNLTAGSLSEALTLRFAVIKSVNS